MECNKKNKTKYVHRFYYNGKWAYSDLLMLDGQFVYGCSDKQLGGLKCNNAVLGNGRLDITSESSC